MDSIERRPAGWYVVSHVCPDGVLRTIGPFPTGSRAAIWVAMHAPLMQKAG